MMKVFLIAAIALAASGNLLLKRGMSALGQRGLSVGIASTMRHALRSPAVWAGTILYAAAMVSWLKVLSSSEIGLVYPIFSGGTTLGVVIASVFLLGERLSSRRIIGTLLMIAGIVVASSE